MVHAAVVLPRSGAAVGVMDITKRDRCYRKSHSGAVALLEFFLAAAGARVVTADIFQRVAHRLLGRMVAVRTVHMAVVVIVVMVVIMIAIRAVNVGLLGHLGYSGTKSPGIISPLRDKCRSRVKNNPVRRVPSRR